MNFNKFFELAKENSLETCEVTKSKANSLSISIFKKEITNYSLNESTRISARGIYKGKMGFVSTEKDDKTTPLYIINSIKDGASTIETDDEAIIFKGADKYKKKNVYNKKLDEWPVEDILSLLFLLEEKLYEKDSRITDVEVAFDKQEEAMEMANSYGLVLKSKSNYYDIVASITIKDGAEVKSSFNVFLDNKPESFDIESFVDETVKTGIEKLHGETIQPGSYKAVLSRDVVDSLLNALISNASAEEVQKHSSSFEGKLHKKIFSDKITVEEKPLANNIFYSYFDGEGVPTQNKTIIKKGVLETYLYNLGTAKKDGVESTGNGQKDGSKVSVSFGNLFLKPGKLSEEQLFEKIHDGVYITSLQGLHAGLDSRSGDFSLQAEGFHVENGKRDKPLTLITVSGNLYKIFNDVIAVGNNTKLLTSATTVPSMAISQLKVSAE